MASRIAPLTDAYLQQLVLGVRQSGAEIVLMAVPAKERTQFPELRDDSPVFNDKVRDWADTHDARFREACPKLFATQLGRTEC